MVDPVLVKRPCGVDLITKVWSGGSSIKCEKEGGTIVSTPAPKDEDTLEKRIESFCKPCVERQLVVGVKALLDENCLRCGVTDGNGRRSCDDHNWRDKNVDPGESCIFRRLRWAAGEKIVVTYMGGEKVEWAPSTDPNHRWYP